MAESIALYLHFPCFDGVASAALASEYLERKRLLETGEIVPVNYDRQAAWAKSKLLPNAVVVDFLYHPKAIFWADHHQTTFASDALKKDYEERKSPDFLYDPDASSCAEVVWRKAYRLLREPHFRELVDWAHRIDGARYRTVEEAVLGDAPALRINQSLLKDSSPEYCRFLVESFRRQPLAEVAKSAMVVDRSRSVRNAIQHGQKIFRSASHLQRNGIVVFQIPHRGDESMVSRYAPYLAYPRARYSVGLTPNSSGAKITAMRNPWMRFKSVPLGEIFRHYGGGGHQRVASVLVLRASDAETMLGAIVRDIESQSAPAPTKLKGSVSS
jgi:hypothetical protein